jgi:hypothetical protein
MEFDRLVESILKESNNDKKIFVIIYNDIVISQGDDIPIDSFLNKHMSGPLKIQGEPISWELGRVSLTETQPEILTFNGGRKSVCIPDHFNKGTYLSIIRDNDIRGKIDVDKMIKVASYNVELQPRTDLPHITNALTSKWVVHQSDNEDGTRTTWYNTMHGSGSSLVVDFEIADKQEYERETTIASHKDHNELVDLIDL